MIPASRRRILVLPFEWDMPGPMTFAKARFGHHGAPREDMTTQEVADEIATILIARSVTRKD
jgi:hypothetical protein